MDKLNLTPQERRLVAGVGLIVFVVLNIWLVWPHFGDWRKLTSDREKAERTLARYRKEVDRLKEYQAKVNALENQGQRVAVEEQDVDLATLVGAQSAANKVEITLNQDVRSATTQTNQFFDEKARRISYRAGTEELVNFLTSLTTAESLIRVSDLNVKPEPPNAPMRLAGEITLVASYQKKAPSKPTTVAENKSTSAPPSRPAVASRRTNNLPGKPSLSSNSATNKAPISTNLIKSGIPKPKPNNPASPKT